MLRIREEEERKLRMGAVGADGRQVHDDGVDGGKKVEATVRLVTVDWVPPEMEVLLNGRLANGCEAR